MKQFRCAFFNFSAEGSNQTGGWSYSGVETEVINNTHVRCNAAHLTSFVVLVSIVDSVGDPVSVDCPAHLNRNYVTCIFLNIMFETLHPSPPLAACTGIHHLHWLQHFITVLGSLNHILLIIEVS